MAKNIIPQGTTAAIKQRVNKYEETQKQRMIEVLQSNVKYADALGFIEVKSNSPRKWQVSNTRCFVGNQTVYIS